MCFDRSLKKKKIWTKILCPCYVYGKREGPIRVGRLQWHGQCRVLSARQCRVTGCGCVFGIFFSREAAAMPSPAAALLLAAAAQAAVSGQRRRCVVEDHGAIADDGLDDSSALFGALAACGGDLGGEIVLAGPGVYNAKPMNLTSNQVLRVAAGAVLQAPALVAGECMDAQSPCPYPLARSFPSYTGSRDFGAPYRLGPFIGAYKAENVSITGGGTIDGAGQYFWRQMRQMRIERPRLVEPMFVRGLQVGPIRLQQSPFWNLHPIYCENVHIHDISIVAEPADGLLGLAGTRTAGSTPNTVRLQCWSS